MKLNSSYEIYHIVSYDNNESCEYVSSITTIDEKIDLRQYKRHPNLYFDLINLPNLTFINLKGSTNVEVPQEIKSRAVDVGGGMWDLEGED